MSEIEREGRRALSDWIECNLVKRETLEIINKIDFWYDLESKHTCCKKAELLLIIRNNIDGGHDEDDQHKILESFKDRYDMVAKIGNKMLNKDELYLLVHKCEEYS